MLHTSLMPIMESADYVLISSLELQGVEMKIHLHNVSTIMMLFSPTGTISWEYLVSWTQKVARRSLTLMETAVNVMMATPSKTFSVFSVPLLAAKLRILLLSQTLVLAPSVWVDTIWVVLAVRLVLLLIVLLAPQTHAQPAIQVSILTEHRVLLLQRQIALNQNLVQLLYVLFVTMGIT